jgi:hypothetical protein
MIRNTTGFISWKSCSPEILSINLIFLNGEVIVENISDITNFAIKNCIELPFN